MLVSDDDREAVAAAIHVAEANTSGEIVVILAAEPENYPATALTVAAFMAFAVPLVAVVLGWRPDTMLPSWDLADPSLRLLRGIEAFAAIQVALFAAMAALVGRTGLARALTPRGLRRDRVHRAALTQFKARGLDATLGRTGVLFYIAEAERIAEVIADAAVFAKVTPDHWAATITALTDGVKAGRPADGIIAAIGLAGGVLAEHFPPVGDNPNELPDRLIEI